MLLLLDVAAEGCMCMQSGHCMYFIFAGLHVIQCVMARAQLNRPAFIVTTSSKAMVSGRCCMLPNGRVLHSIACDRRTPQDAHPAPHSPAASSAALNL